MSGIRLLYLNSFSRSGETLLLRTLNAHKDVAVLHQILRHQDESDDLYDVFKRIKKEKPEYINLSAAEKTAIGVDRQSVLLVKNAVFTMDKPHFGFTLVRNPFSVYASYRKLSGGLDDVRSQMRRWARNIDAELLTVVEEGSFLEAFSALYARKCLDQITFVQPVIHYENFVYKPKRALLQLVEALGLDWDDAMMRAHKRYPEGQRGHGGIDLSAPIRADKAFELPELSPEEIRVIYSYVSGAIRYYGYRFDFAKRKVAIGKSLLGALRGRR